MNLRTSIFLAFCTVILLSSCNENVISSGNTQPPVITTITPAAMQGFNFGDTVFMMGTIEDLSGEPLHGFNLELRNITQDTLVYSYNRHAHNPALNFSGYWVNNVKVESDMQLIISAAANHVNAVYYDTLYFRCLPQ